MGAINSFRQLIQFVIKNTIGYAIRGANVKP